jgi:hypothetical protein
MQVYCENCEEPMELISQTISNDILAKRSKILEIYKCHSCKEIKVFKKDRYIEERKDKENI